MFVVAQRGHGGWVQKQSTGLAELRVLDHQRLGVQIDLVAIEAARFAGAHAGHRKQPDQRLPGRSPQRRGQPARGLVQRVGIGGRVEVRGKPVFTLWQHVFGRDFGGRNEGLHMPGEDAHHHQSTGQVCLVTAAARGPSGPVHRQFGGDAVGMAGLAVIDEPHQVAALGNQLEPQGSPHHQIILSGLAKPTHDRSPPGHGRANTRSALSSTLA
jgi:hypothetical protein